MNPDRKPARRRSWLALDVLIVLGLVLKLATSAAFIFYGPGSENSSPFEPRPALAGESKPAQHAPTTTPAPAAAPATAKTPNPAAGNMPGEVGQYQALLDSLRAREAELKKREQQANEREAALAVLEKQINARLAEIEATKQKLSDLVKRHEQLVEEQKQLRDARVEHLVSAYKGMRPEKAGILVNSLEDDVAIEILSAMPGKAAGQILSFVEPAKAARLTKGISDKAKNLEQGQAPGPAQTPGPVAGPVPKPGPGQKPKTP